MTRSVSLLAAALALGAASVSAQNLSVGLAGAHARYADSLSGTAALASVRLRATTLRHAYDLEGSLSRFSGGDWAVQLGMRGTALAPVGRLVRAGVTGSATLNGFDQGPVSGIATGGPLVALAGPDWLVLGSVGIGGARTVAGDARSLSTGALAFRWFPGSNLSFDAALSGTGADEVRYADLTLGGAMTHGQWQFGAALGARTGHLGDLVWGDVRGQFVPRGRWSLEAAMGRYPPDVTGFTDGLYGLVGVRIAVSGPRGDLAAAPPPAASAVQVERVDGRLVRITLRRGGEAARLAIAGEFSDWQEVELTREGGGVWSAVVPIAPGVHRYALVMDGEWTLPDGVAGVPDDFGGRVGLLVVPAS